MMEDIVCTLVKSEDKVMNKNDVEKIGRLSRLKLSKEEVEFYTEHLTMVLKHFEELASINTDDVEPMVTPVVRKPLIAEDEVRRTVSPEDILKNAPEKSGNLFRVPPVVGVD